MTPSSVLSVRTIATEEEVESAIRRTIDHHEDMWLHDNHDVYVTIVDLKITLNGVEAECHVEVSSYGEVDAIIAEDGSVIGYDCEEFDEYVAGVRYFYDIEIEDIRDYLQFKGLQRNKKDGTLVMDLD